MAPGTHSTYFRSRAEPYLAVFRSRAEPYLAVRWPTHWAANIVASRSGCREAPWDMARYHPPCGLPVALPRPTSTSSAMNAPLKRTHMTRIGHVPSGNSATTRQLASAWVPVISQACLTCVRTGSSGVISTSAARSAAEPPPGRLPTVKCGTTSAYTPPNGGNCGNAA